MKVAARVVTVVFLLILLSLCIGFVMPSHYSVQRTAVLPAPPESVYTRVATLRTWDRWSAWNARRDPSLVYSYEGPETGAGSVMRWTSRKMGDGHLDLVNVDPKRSVQYDLRMAGSDFTAHGTIQLEPTSGGTRVTWRDDGNLGSNPVYHLMGPFMDKLLGADFERSLDGLRRELSHG